MVDIQNWIQQLQKAKRKQKNRRLILRILAIIVVFVTTYALILPAITLESPAICGLTEHTHGEQCYALQKPTACTLPETPPHTHEDRCFEKQLLCTSAEDSDHTHDDTCYTLTQNLVCGLEASEGHSHESDSTEPVKELICTLTEHTHTESCYPMPETETTVETTPAEANLTEDLETQEIWEASLAAVVLTDDPGADIIEIARTQLGYEESHLNYICDENNVIYPYTRYGQWLGQPYGTWNATFVSFCLHYCGAEDFAPTASAEELLQVFQEKEYYRLNEDYLPSSGDLIFFDQDADGNCDAVAIIEEPFEDGSLQIISGAVNGRVDRVTVLAADSTVMGFGVLPAKAAENSEVPYIHEAEDGSLTQVQFIEEPPVPLSATLSVTEIPPEEESYAPMVSQLENLLDETPGKISLLDISFYDENGDYLSVQDTAQVIMDLDIGDADPETIKVFHFMDDGPVELDTVSINQTETVTTTQISEETPPQAHTQLVFETEGFSVFAVVETPGNGDRIDATDVSALAGNTYYIVSNNENYVMTDIRHFNGRGLDKGTYLGPEYLDGQTTWTFLQVADNTFRIRSNNGLYLVMEDTTANAASLYTTESETDATVFTLRAINNQVEIGYDGPNGIAHYLNVFGGDQDFCGWRDDGIQDSGSKVYLHQKKEASVLDSVTDLGGKAFALINGATTKAIGTQTATVNGVPGLQSVVTQIFRADGTAYYIGDAPIWSFEETETEGVYYIATQIQETKQYLRFLDTYHNGNTAVSKGSLTLGDVPQPIHVTANDDGTVYLSVQIGANTGYINLDQSGSGHFWVYNDAVDSNKLLLAERMSDAVLQYELNAPSGVSWLNAPAVTQSVQLLTGESASLQSIEGASAGGTFVDKNIGRATVKQYYDNYNAALGTNLTPETYKSPGAEYRFLGWTATVNGESYYFAENAAVTNQDDGIHITDMDGVERILPHYTQLSCRWEKVSDVVLFFVNFGATMLENQDNKVITSYDSPYYTGVAAIAHIYNETTIQPSKNYYGSDIITRSNDALIQAEIVPVYDAANTGTQIVIDAVATINSAGTDFIFESVSNYNQAQLENAVGLYLQNDPNTSTQVKIDNAYVDKSEITSEHYKLYWYLQKEVSDDGWHIDGVLVAKTSPMEIYKTFSGLTAAEASTAISQMQFPLSLIDMSGRKQAYTTLTANASQPGVYTNDGKQSEGNIYKWTLQAIQGQRYAVAETGHLISGHDWSGLVSVHFTNGDVQYHYQTNTTYDTTDLYNGMLVGGQVESVIFANFYTQTGTGAFSISKVADEAGRIRLQGAEFTLTGVNVPGYKVTAVTNENGALHFADLARGTYTLAETKAPEGYQKTDDTWTVFVTQINGVAKVTIQKDGSNSSPVVVYDGADGGIQQVYLIQNDPEDTTVTVNKYFSVISNKEIRELTGYGIEVRDQSGAVKNTLTLANATPITGSTNGYTWTINLNCDEEYTFVEKNFLHKNYLDTVVTVQHNNTTLEPVKTDSDNDGVPDTATITIQKSDSADTINITNAYTNTFKLKIRKVDATGNYAPMQGVEFNIYGSFSEATGSESLEYVDSNGVRHTAYLIGTTAPTDAAGITWYDNMKLSAGSRSFVYVVDEVVTPAGYVELDEPIVKIVEVDGENYANGVYTLTVENFKRDLADVTVTATTQWNIPDDMECSDVKLALYRKSADGSVVRLQEVTLDGTDKPQSEDASGIKTTITGWTVVWQGLTYADNATRYEYFVTEEPLAGYHIGYNTEVHTLQVGTDNIDAAIAEGTNLKRSVTIVNSCGYALPNTGGSGIRYLQLYGYVLLISAAVLLWRIGRKRQQY